MKLELKPFDQHAFDQALATFHSAAPAAIVQVGTLEYMLALSASLREGNGLHNLSLTAIEHMTPEAALFAQTGDYRAFVPGQAFIDDVAANVVKLIGITHWYAPWA